MFCLNIENEPIINNSTNQTQNEKDAKNHDEESGQEEEESNKDITDEYETTINNVIVDPQVSPNNNNHVNKGTAVTADEDEEEKQTLLAQLSAATTANEDNSEQQKTAEEDEESTLIESEFERPYTAPLAPIDMDLIERLRREHETKRVSSSAGKRRESRSSWARKSADSSQFAVTMFMERERSQADAGREKQQQQLNEFQTIVGTPADHDSQKQPPFMSSNTNTAER